LKADLQRVAKAAMALKYLKTKKVGLLNLMFTTSKADFKIAREEKHQFTV